MRVHLPVLITLALVAGCTSDWDPGRKSAQVGPAPSPTSLPAKALHASSARAGHASLRDHGALLAFDSRRAVMHSGAFTGYPVELSEDHAFKATRSGGQITVPMPGRGSMRFVYERHVEHPDGNWTWIGRSHDGLDALITFGEKAVFGTISQHGAEPLRLAMSGGRSWLVETDVRKLPAGQTDRKDYLVPPDVAGAAASGMYGSFVAAQLPTTKAVGTTIDVVLGFTNGFAASLNGASQANTRLVNLVDITNQAYANSQIEPRIRLVRTVQVDYPDNTDNTSALEALTGFHCTSSGCTSIAVPAALQSLRVARDQHGGDLVVLVRDFRVPENDGCGLAWLVGGGGGGIDAGDAPFGYSIVSHGEDLDENDGKTYFCRELTLAHELGHNMGQQHNIENSDGDQGVHPYSYGYREASDSGFFTVMAYPKPNSGQFSIRYFANPNVAYQGRTTGVANAADNTRSLNLAMPAVAMFRATVTGDDAGSDINGDGRDDVVWHRPAASQLAYWLMNGATISGSAVMPAQPGLTLVGTGDFNGNGRAELLWDANGIMYTSTFNGSGFDGAMIGSHEAGWIAWSNAMH